MNRKYKTETFTIRTVFDTALCDIDICYQPETEHIIAVWGTSSLGETGQSKKKWVDIGCYGQCDLEIKDLAILAEIADSIKDKEWKICSSSTPLTDESVKQKILHLLYNAEHLLADFVYDNLKDTTGLMEIWDFKREIKRKYEVDIPLCYLFNLFETDSRFIIKNKKIDHADIGLNCEYTQHDTTCETEDKPLVQEEKPIFGYKEFMDWVTNDKDLKARFDAYFANWKNKPTDIDGILSFFRISPDSYSCGQFVDGCYQDDEGNWYYYLNDERTSPTPNGIKATEDECFRFLETSLLVRIQHHEEDKRREAERIANLTPEQKAKREREADRLRKIHLAQNLFFTVNGDTIVWSRVSVTKIYNAFDDSDEGDETFRIAKEQYIAQYGEKKGIKLLKILKFMTYFQNGGYITDKDARILQKVNKIFVEMLKKK